jgi:hypothetical protein
MFSKIRIFYKPIVFEQASPMDINKRLKVIYFYSSYLVLGEAPTQTIAKTL